ncbi:MAG: PAS domain S-box protein [Magnetococcales bacterium]|nr:PAS domain S-box protein [Magnetococcales bacterium]
MINRLNLESAVTSMGGTPMGFAVRCEDDLLSPASPALRDMTANWGGVQQWWQMVRANMTLPAATQCPVCNLAQILGTTDVILENATASGERISHHFLIAFNGHIHGLTDGVDGESGDMLLIHDMTGQMKALETLRNTIKHFESLCASIEDVYYRVDRTSELLFISPSCQRLLAYRPEELVGLRMSELCIDPDYWTELMEILSSVDQVQEFEVIFQCKRGNHVPVALNARVVRDDHGEKIGFEGIFRDMREREQLDTILAERTRQLQETMAELEHQKFAMDQHAMVTITDPDGLITYANRKTVEVSQHTFADLKGQSHRILNSGYHPKSFFREMWRAISSGRVWHGEIRNRRKDGSIFWVDSTIVPFMTPSGKPFRYVSIGTDITDRILAEQRLDHSRSFLLSITDALGEGVYVLDLQGRVTFFNTEAERLLGWRESELLGKNLHDTIHFKRKDGSPLPAEDCPVHRSLLGRGFRIDTDHFIRKDGSFMPVSYITTPLMEGHELTGSVAIFQDISNRLQQEAELRRERDSSLEASRLKSEFLANMSHEIRTPMNAIIGMNDLLMDTPLNEDQYEFAEIVRESSQSLLALINDILDFSKIEAGRIDLETIDFSLVTVVEGSAELLASQVHSKRISLMTFISPEVPRTLRGDPGRIRQLLLNLMSNAVKFTDEGEVVARVKVESESDEHTVIHISVSDTGIGLSPKAHARLFQPFTQANEDTSRKYGGTGLGLAISKRLVDLMGGEIGVNSREGVGSVFWFRIPLQRSRLVEGQENDALNLDVLHDLRFLVVMPRESDREILESYLGHWGRFCRGAASVDDAIVSIRIAEEKGRPYHIVLVDVALDGQEEECFARILQRQNLLENVHLIAVSDDESREWHDCLEGQGYSSGISKPIRQAELVEAIIGIVNPELVCPRVEPFTAEAGTVRNEGAPVPLPEPDAYDALESGKLLLLAEDNPVNQRVALMQLKKLGYAVHAVSNGKEAVEAVNHLPYALILMDCQMPVMDGFEATHAIRRMDRISSRHVPIIAMTANAMKGDREHCLQAGMDDYLSKPVNPEVLRAKLEYWIPRSAGELPPIDLSQLQQLFGNDERVIRELLQQFLPAAVELIERIEQRLTSHDAAGLADSLNELHGTCVNVGASAMARVTRRMERAVGALDWGEARNTMTSLTTALTHVENFSHRY